MSEKGEAPMTDEGKDRGIVGKVFILYDGRAKSGDTDDASVLCTAHSEHQARFDSSDFRQVDAVWYEYDVINKEGVNEKRRDDIGRGILL